ncbi:MAG: cobalamin-binding protein [Deltaproteobacteria bacterium]|nr:MAG: cobalamin-binding protein [Deltaproteobacteria bacterium]
MVPSTTETLFDLGCGARVVGCTRFCVRPADRVRGLPKIGGTKDVEVDRVRALSPDLIFGNCEENTREIFEALEPIAPLWAPLPRTVDEALLDLRVTGRLVDQVERAESWSCRIRQARERLHAARTEPFTYAYLIWRDPYMSVSDDTFIASMLSELGGVNAFAHHPVRFPTVTADQLGALAPDRVLLSSEPFPFRDRHRSELCEASGLPPDRVRFIDGELASWHGTRMARAFEAFATLLRDGFPTHPITRSRR